MRKNALKIAFGMHFDAPGCVLDGLGRVWGGGPQPAPAQNRAKNAPQELGKVDSRALCDALGRSWALFCDFG